MLSPLAYLLVLLFLNLPALAEEKVMDPQRTSLSWVKNLNRHVERLAHTHQDEAKDIVDQASTQSKYCKTAEILAHQAQQVTLKSLDIPPDEDNTRYSKLVVFVSFSLPLETLKTLATQVNQVGGKVVFRGLVNGSFRKTAEKVKELQQEVMIDPPLFEEYQIEVVPTFILRRHKSKENGKAISHKDALYDQLSGNVSLEYALDQFASHGTTTPEASELLKKLRKEP